MMRVLKTRGCRVTACHAALAASFLSSIIPAGLRASDPMEIELRLKEKYLGRNVILKGFYRGDQLDYDVQGDFAGKVVAGTWTLDGIVTLTDFKMRGDRLEISADRTVLGFSYQHRHLYALPDKPVEIVVHLGPSIPTWDALGQILSQMFIFDLSKLAQYAPAYWKPITDDAGWARYAKNPRKPPESLTLFGPLNAPDGEPVYFSDGEAHNGLDPPQPIDEPPPYYPELARHLKKQGSLLMAVLIDRQGLVRDALLLGDPLGDGLDQSSVNTVRRWKYRPAMLNAAPVSVIKPEPVTFSISRR
jgi:TonB family protein